jgi:hypothetical protein
LPWTAGRTARWKDSCFSVRRSATGRIQLSSPRGSGFPSTATCVADCKYFAAKNANIAKVAKTIFDEVLDVSNKNTKAKNICDALRQEFLATHN